MKTKYKIAIGVGIGIVVLIIILVVLYIVFSGDSCDGGPADRYEIWIEMFNNYPNLPMTYKIDKTSSNSAIISIIMTGQAVDKAEIKDFKFGAYTDASGILVLGPYTSPMTFVVGELATSKKDIKELLTYNKDWENTCIADDIRKVIK